MEPVLLINCPRELSPRLSETTDKRMPLGLLYISAVLKANGIRCKVIDAEAGQLGISDILGIAHDFRPALIGLNCHTLNRWTVYETAQVLRVTIPSATIVLGGAHPSLAPVTTLTECPAADAVVVGEGELTCLDLARTTGDLAGVRGLYLRDGGKARSTGRRHRIQDLDSLPYPDLEDIPIREYFEYEDADLPGLWRRAYLAASRGCRYRCSFCTEWPQWGATDTFRSARSVLGEIDMYRSRYGVRNFYFYDDTLTDWPQWREFSECASAEGIRWSCSTRIDHLDDKTIELLGRGGCQEIAVGLEAGSPDILKIIRKDLSEDLREDGIIRVIKSCRATDIRLRAHFMIGFPRETRADISSTVRFALRLRDAGLPDANFFTVKVYPGTTFAARMARHNLSGSGAGTDLTESWSVHDAFKTADRRVAAKLRRFNDIALYPVNEHLDSLSVRILARRAWELFFGDFTEADVEHFLWEGITWW